MSAFLYLTWASARNRLRIQLERVRTPRYAAALIVGILYIYAFLLRRGVRTAAGDLLLGRSAEAVATLLAFLTLAGTWVFGSDLTALAFSDAELSMLFPAPLSRRQLIGYKLYKSQLTVLLNAVLWVFLLHRGGTYVPAPLRALAIWALFSTLSLHRLGAALVRASWHEHGRVGVRFHWLSIAVFAVLALLLASGLFRDRAELLSVNGVDAFFAMLAYVLSKPPASIALYPIHLAIAPTFARSTREWFETIWPSLALVAAHAWWVLRTNIAFEDAAIVASAERAKRSRALQARRSATAAPPRAATTSWRLSPSGHPAIAIVWKNFICLRRTAQLRLFVAPLAMALVLGAAVSGAQHDLPGFIATSALVLLAMLLIFGGRLIRNDLRHDMLHLPLLKSLPVSPSQIVLAEVAGAAGPLAVVQLVLFAIAYVASVHSLLEPLGASLRGGIAIGAPFAILALNAALLTIQNGTAVLFPAWIRLGPSINTGVEALGQNLLATAASLIALAIALVVPAGIAVGAARLLPGAGVGTIAAAIIVAALVLAVETYGVMILLGRALARAEPSAQL